MAFHPAPALIFSALTNRRAATPATPARPRVAPAPTPAPAPISTEARATSRASTRRERNRWKAVVYSSAFESAPAVGAHLLAGTDMPSAAIVGLLRAIATDEKAASMASPEGIARRWAAAAKRAGVQ